MTITTDDTRDLEDRVASAEANYESAVQRLNEMQLLCYEAADALRAAQRYGAGDFTDLIERLAP